MPQPLSSPRDLINSSLGMSTPRKHIPIHINTGTAMTGSSVSESLQHPPSNSNGPLKTKTRSFTPVQAPAQRRPAQRRPAEEWLTWVWVLAGFISSPLLSQSGSITLLRSEKEGAGLSGHLTFSIYRRSLITYCIHFIGLFITKYHILNGLQYKTNFLTVVEDESLRSSCQLVGFL